MSTNLRMRRVAGAGPCVGARVPELTLAGVSTVSHGEPRVLAFVQRAVFEPEAAVGPAVAGIRAQLRGLGAEVVVLSPAGGWWVRAHDAIEPLREADVTGAAAAVGVSGDEDAGV